MGGDLMAFHATIERRKLEVFFASMTAGFGLFLTKNNKSCLVT